MEKSEEVRLNLFTLVSIVQVSNHHYFSKKCTFDSVLRIG